MFRLVPACPALAGLAVSLLVTTGAGPAGPAAPSQPGPAPSRPPVTVLRAHGSSAGGRVQTSFSCHETGARGPARRSTTHTLTVTGTDPAGQPDTGGVAWVFNTDSCASVRGEQYFSHGRATFRVPAGHYLVMGEFITGPRAHRAVRLDVLPQVTVAGNTTTPTAARSASSRLTLATPRPATLQDATFTLIRTGQAGQTRARLAFNAFGYDGMALWVSPVSQRPTAGGLTAYTTATLTSPPGPGVPYTYSLAFAGPRGLIPRQQRTVTDAHLAAVTERYYQDRKTSGLYAVAGGLRGQIEQGGAFAEWLPMHLPGRQIQYFTPGRPRSGNASTSAKVPAAPRPAARSVRSAVSCRARTPRTGTPTPCTHLPLWT